MRTSSLHRSPSPIALLCLMVARQFPGRTDAYSVHDRASTLLRPLSRLSRALSNLPVRINAAFATFLDRCVTLVLRIANAGTIHFVPAGVTASPDGAVCLSTPPVPYGWTSLDLDTDDVPAVCADAIADPFPPASFLKTIIMTSTVPPVEPDLALSLSPDHKDIGGRTADYYSLLRKSARERGALTDREWATRHLPLSRGADGTLSPVLPTADLFSVPLCAAEDVDGVLPLPVPAQEVPSPAPIALKPSIAPVSAVLPAAPLSEATNGHTANGKPKRTRKVKESVGSAPEPTLPAPSDREAKLRSAADLVKTGQSVRAAAALYGLSKNTLTRFIARN